MNCGSGDADAIIPFTGTRTLIDGLAKELGLNVTVPYRAWFEGKQVNFHIKFTYITLCI
jgi:serine carboxypeptidase-like clade 2